MLYRLFDATLIKMLLNFIPSVAAVINASIADSTFYVDIVRLINFIIISSIVFQLTVQFSISWVVANYLCLPCQLEDNKDNKNH